MFFIFHICGYHTQNLEGEQALLSSPAFISAFFLGLHTKPVTNSSLLFPPNSRYYKSPQQLKRDSPHSPISAGIALGSLILSGGRKHYQGTIHHFCFEHALQEEMIVHWRQNTLGIQSSSSLKVTFTQMNASISASSPRQTLVYLNRLQRSLTHHYHTATTLQGLTSHTLPILDHQM